VRPTGLRAVRPDRRRDQDRRGGDGDMKLPNLEKAVVREQKITEYLLSPTHRDGRHKAAFFTAFGFSAENWRELAEFLRRHAAEHEVAREEGSPFGKR